MIFYKSVASGNDFLQINIEDFAAQSLTKGELALQMCNRHTGPGADGVVYYRIDPALRISFEIFNCDGSEAELSGNGMGGLAALMFFLEHCSQTAEMETKVGRRTHTLLHRDRNRFRLNIHIGPPDFNALTFFPFLKEGVDAYQCNGITFYPVSVGNPHVVVIKEEHMEDEELGEALGSIGAMLEQADIFPHKTNVEIVLPHPGRTPGIFFYERGVGRTLASSTGSAAVFAVLRKLGRIEKNLIIPSISSETNSQSPKTIKITGKNNIFIENSVEIVYKGVYIKNHKK